MGALLRNQMFNSANDNELFSASKIESVRNYKGPPTYRRKIAQRSNPNIVYMGYSHTILPGHIYFSNPLL